MTTPFVATRPVTEETWPAPDRPRQAPLYRCVCGHVWMHVAERPSRKCRECGRPDPERVGFAHWDTNGDVTPLDAVAEAALALLPERPADNEVDGEQSLGEEA